MVEEIRFEVRKRAKFQIEEIEALNSRRDELKRMKEARQRSEVEAKRTRERNAMQITFLEK